MSAYAEIDAETIEKSGEELFVLSRRKLNPVFLEIGKKLEDPSAKPALILRSYCVICKECTYPDSPCRFLEIAGVSVETHGVRMISMMEKYGFSRFSNARGYTCIALILFDCDDLPEISFGERVLLKEYPEFVEGQHYVDSLYELGEISCQVSLSGCKPLGEGVHAFNCADMQKYLTLADEDEM